MRLSDCIAADRLVVPLQSATLAEAADVLTARLVASGAVGDVERLRRRLAEQRPEDTVALGDRAMLLHVRTDAVPDLCVAIGISPTPLCREVGDGERQCARIVMLIVAPPRQAARYLQLLSAFARVLSRPESVATVLAAPTAEAVAALPLFANIELPEQLAVRDLMTERLRTVGPDAPLWEAAQTMVRAGLSALPVVSEDGQVIGLLTERELMRHMLAVYLQGAARGASAQGRLVRDAMTRQVLCVSPDQPLAEVASLIINKDVDRVPVVREGRLVGVLTRSDIVRKLLGS